MRLEVHLRRASCSRGGARKLRKWTAIVTIILPSVMLSGTAVAQSTHGSEAKPSVIRVDATPGHVINSFDPDRALGSSIDVLSHDGIDKVYTPHIIQESLSAGWGPSYRNNSELRMAAWHWTENGTWSDQVHKSGYFTGSTELKEPVRYILSYALPHRGFSTSGDHPSWVRTSVTGRAIHIWPASSPGKATPSIRNGSSSISRPKSP